MNSIKIFGKFLDQPILISKLEKTMPIILTSAAAVKVGYDYYQTSKKSEGKTKQQKELLKKDFTKKAIVTMAAVASAVSTPKILGKFFDKKPTEILSSDKIDKFVSENNIDEKTTEILNKAKNKVLSLNEVKHLSDKFEKLKNGSEFFNKLIPDPKNISSKEIFSEIGYLSAYGAIPVIGGVLGGVAADIVTKDDPKKNISDKISEAVYQYLANIFMCNVGAGIALEILEKAKITSKSARALGMTAGIVLTGILGGSKIANFISKKIINPIVSPNKKIKERKPEPLDICLHTDDIATVAVLSGLKWIEPCLPVLYSVSGYRAGTGYRN